MRPERLELSGFTAFTEPTVVELGDADLFALAGPTGAGKTSLLDAMCFALYGSVPRLDDLRLVAPIVSLGRNEAKVRLDFTIGGVAHTAVRVVRRDAKTGRATTKEARLERGEEVLAKDADGVTAAVTRLLGLSFGEFCRCVLLPQGAFARFLHDKPKDRQDLLVGLIGAELYGEVRERAVERQRAAQARVDALTAQVAAAPTEDDLAAARAALATVADAVGAVQAAEAELAALTTEEAAASGSAAEAAARATALGAVRVPPGVADLAQALATASADVVAAEQAEERAAAALTAAEEAAPADTALRAVEHGLAAHADLLRLQGEGVEVEATATRAEAAAARADERARQAHEALEAARQASAAAALAPALAVGEPCPVCLQPVAALPHHAEASAWAPFRDAAKTADDAARAAASAAGAATDRLERHRAALAEATAAVDPAGSATALEAQQLAHRRARTALEEATAADRDARRRARTARTSREEAAGAEQRARRELDAARDRLAALTPPPLARDDLGADWRALAAWAGARAPVEEAAAATARAEAAEAARKRQEREAALRAGLVDAGAEVPPRARLAEAAAAALATVEAREAQVAGAVGAAVAARADLARAEAGVQVAKALALHLKADGFERWLLDEAFGELLAGATEVLQRLSEGAYSLGLDAKRELVVVDHRNADARRPVRTLSGGETFLASLALALSLADRVSALAPGQVRLEALFLDEGFGTLDPEALDVVAGAIEHLGASGRMVGVVTHVPELAERMPVRFEVRRGKAGATVERVVA